MHSVLIVRDLEEPNKTILCVSAEYLEKSVSDRPVCVFMCYVVGL